MLQPFAPTQWMQSIPGAFFNSGVSIVKSLQQDVHPPQSRSGTSCSLPLSGLLIGLLLSLERISLRPVITSPKENSLRDEPPFRPPLGLTAGAPARLLIVVGRQGEHIGLPHGVHAPLDESADMASEPIGDAKRQGCVGLEFEAPDIRVINHGLELDFGKAARFHARALDLGR